MDRQNKFPNNSYFSNDFVNNSPRSVSTSNQKKGEKKKFSKIFIVAIVLVALFLSRNKIKGFISSYKSRQMGNQAVKGEGTVQSQTISLDKKFNFPGFDDVGKKKDTIELRITEVEKTDQVMVQDKNYTAKNNKIFLIINLELKNETTQRLNIFPGDLVRLIIDDQEEKKLAPDLHNNYVLVSPISTKVDRVGFIIDQDFNDLKLQIGELDSEKEILEIRFPT